MSPNRCLNSTISGQDIGQQSIPGSSTGRFSSMPSVEEAQRHFFKSWADTQGHQYIRRPSNGPAVLREVISNDVANRSAQTEAAVDKSKTRNHSSRDPFSGQTHRHQPVETSHTASRMPSELEMRDFRRLAVQDGLRSLPSYSIDPGVTNCKEHLRTSQQYISNLPDPSHLDDYIARLANWIGQERSTLATKTADHLPDPSHLDDFIARKVDNIKWSLPFISTDYVPSFLNGPFHEQSHSLGVVKVAETPLTRGKPSERGMTEFQRTMPLQNHLLLQYLPDPPSDHTQRTSAAVKQLSEQWGHSLSMPPHGPLAPLNGNVSDQNNYSQFAAPMDHSVFPTPPLSATTSPVQLCHGVAGSCPPEGDQPPEILQPPLTHDYLPREAALFALVPTNCATTSYPPLPNLTLASSFPAESTFSLLSETDAASASAIALSAANIARAPSPFTMGRIFQAVPPISQDADSSSCIRCPRLPTRLAITLAVPACEPEQTLSSVTSLSRSSQGRTCIPPLESAIQPTDSRKRRRGRNSTKTNARKPAEITSILQPSSVFYPLPALRHSAGSSISLYEDPEQIAPLDLSLAAYHQSSSLFTTSSSSLSWRKQLASVAERSAVVVSNLQFSAKENVPSIPASAVPLNEPVPSKRRKLAKSRGRLRKRRRQEEQQETDSDIYIAPSPFVSSSSQKSQEHSESHTLASKAIAERKELVHLPAKRFLQEERIVAASTRATQEDDDIMAIHEDILKENIAQPSSRHQQQEAVHHAEANFTVGEDVTVASTDVLFLSVKAIGDIESLMTLEETVAEPGSSTVMLKDAADEGDAANRGCTPVVVIDCDSDSSSDEEEDTDVVPVEVPIQRFGMPTLPQRFR